MPDDPLAQLVAHVGEFYITDRAMLTAQKKMQQALQNGKADERARNDYLSAVRRYFSAFEREAREHLRDVDKRLEHVNQVHFNLTAERGVAVKRIEGTQAVLQELDRVAGS